MLKVEEPVHTGPAAPIFKSIAEGARFVVGNRIMVGAMALDMFSVLLGGVVAMLPDRKSTRLNSSHSQISYAVFCLKKKKNMYIHSPAVPALETATRGQPSGPGNQQ